ncbi:MAG: hypothetical protein OXF26_01290 [Alphaproteobacteria bacterium]|nr:hypothetical protein [Alphaproteobacteria bacterium]MCY4229522.1 hypothetical protein [Alphaproteobacteria bacterium]
MAAALLHAREGAHVAGAPRGMWNRYPFGRHGTGWETAYAPLFLMSRESASRPRPWPWMAV